MACCLREGGPYEQMLHQIGVRVKNFNMKSLFDFRVIFKIAKFIRQNKVNIVNTAVFPADIYGRISAKLARVPIILSTMHRFEDHKQEKVYRYLFWLDRWTMTFTSKLIAVSKTVRQYLIEWHHISPTKIITLYNGIDIEKYANTVASKQLLEEFQINDNCQVVGAIGRLVPVKGLNYFLDAAAIILQKTKNVKFLIVGDGPLKVKLQKKAKSLGVADYITFTGFRNDIPVILNIVDLYVISSLSEGLPTAVLEAASASKAVVGTNVGAIPETVIDGETGILVPPKDSRTLADGILNLLDAPEKSRIMGEKGRQRVIENFSLDKMVANYEELYDSL
jgi:glycosyltransferase involved in cell wall biosynthesis